MQPTAVRLSQSHRDKPENEKPKINPGTRNNIQRQFDYVQTDVAITDWKLAETFGRQRKLVGLPTSRGRYSLYQTLDPLIKSHQAYTWGEVTSQ